MNENVLNLRWKLDEYLFHKFFEEHFEYIEQNSKGPYRLAPVFGDPGSFLGSTWNRQLKYYIFDFVKPLKIWAPSDNF